jgi:putative membrane protein
MLQPAWQKNDRKANRVIIIFSVIVLAAISALTRVKLNVNLGFDAHLFAKANAIINSMVSLLLVAGLLTIKKKNALLHKRIMLTAMGLSVLFLISYICHHLFAGETKYGDLNLDGKLDDAEKAAAGTLRYVYYIIISTHILLAGIVMPFVLYSAYRALTGEYEKHKKLVRITWPVWFYVAVTGVVVYWMISPYYR